MTLIEYRGNKLLLDKATRILGDPDFRQMLEVLRGSRPNKIAATGYTPQDHSLLLGFTQGWETALDSLIEMGTPLPRPRPALSETYPELK